MCTTLRDLPMRFHLDIAHFVGGSEEVQKRSRPPCGPLQAVMLSPAKFLAYNNLHVIPGYDLCCSGLNPAQGPFEYITHHGSGKTACLLGARSCSPFLQSNIDQPSIETLCGSISLVNGLVKFSLSSLSRCVCCGHKSQAATG